VVTIVLALAAAFMYGTGVALQHREAAAMPGATTVRLGFLLQLFRRPLWLLGLAADISGFALQAAALARGSLVVVEPIVATSLLFSFATVAVLAHGHLDRRELAAALLVVGGLAVFFVVASPDVTSRDTADGETWLVAALVVGGLVALLALAATYRSSRRRAAALAVAAGLANGFVAVASKAFAQKLDDGLLDTLRSWEPYVLAGSGIVATLMIQSAYQANLPTLTFPLIEVTGPLTAAAAGVAMFGEHLSVGGGRGVLVALALAVTATGIVVLGRHPLLADNPTAAGATVD
jgi:drug/metabolite transporter (DMT)-like permease